MSAKISFLPEGMGGGDQVSKPVLTVPSGSVATRNGKRVVYQVKEDRAVEIAVVVGQEMGGLVEIQDGLKAGEKVVARVDGKIQPGSKVIVQVP
jgi:hypothetical protein